MHRAVAHTGRTTLGRALVGAYRGPLALRARSLARPGARFDAQSRFAVPLVNAQAGAARGYHDESFGFRKARELVLPDYSPAQLRNRADNAPLLRYVDAVRTHAHRAATIDPLDLLKRERVAALDPARYGLTDPSKTYNVSGILWTRPVGEATEVGAKGPKEDGEEGEWWTLAEITGFLSEVYLGRIAYEYMDLPSKSERLWFAHLLERDSPRRSASSNEGEGEAGERRPRTRHGDEVEPERIHELLAKSEVLDHFLQAKFPNLKRYGLEGAESMLPALDALFGAASRAGIGHIILAMPHRGRLNLLSTLLEYAPTALFHKIRGGAEIPEDLGASGDVISHLVASPTLEYAGAPGPIKVSLQPNPSHLEAISPVALGKARAKQFSLLKSLSKGKSINPDGGVSSAQRTSNTSGLTQSPEEEAECGLGDRVMCVQLHGDASFTGQGVVMETLGLSNLPHYTSGGSVHIVVNNNIGYTTPASSARSSLYASDISKMINCPVLHVNGDYPEDVVRAVEVAFEYRNYFRKDIVIDLIVYRRWGHNELDEPAFTQPRMYEKIRSRQSVPGMYEAQLIKSGALSEDQASKVRASYHETLESALAAVPSHKPSASMCAGQWEGMVWPASREADHAPDTGVQLDELKTVGRASVTVPEGFEIHPRLQRHVKKRLQSIDKGVGMDWATAEAMAFGSLMREGTDVRISGQDVGRGTFSHRHAMLVDQKTEGVIVPLNTELRSEGTLELANSSLSEMAVLGFEYGASWERPNVLPIWEAQFGDFFNGAQVIIDTFISQAETKWLKQSGIVLLLPHGLDGAGPEHSSSRIERFLQLSNDRYINDPSEPLTNANMHIVFPTTPAQYFHLLRRQIRRNYRKPLIVAAPKTLLRLPAASSSLEDLAPGTRFKPVLDDPAISKPGSVKRVVLLSGKLYYDIVRERSARGLDDAVALVRVEELSPFPFMEVRDVLDRYLSASSIKDVVWLQEEPRNQGAYAHVAPRIESVLQGLGYEGRLVYKGRREDAVAAPGIGKFYQAQQKCVLEGAFDGL